MARNGRELLVFWAALQQHLMYNLYPPKSEWLKVAQQAIEAVEEGDPERRIDASDVISAPEGLIPYVKACEVVDNLRLEDLVAVQV